MKEWRIVSKGVDVGVVVATSAKTARALAERARKVKPHEADVRVSTCPAFCVCDACALAKAEEHAAADLRCGRPWSCTCGACNRSRARKMSLRKEVEAGETDYERKVGHATVQFHVDTSDRLIHVVSLRVPGRHRGEGDGKRAMQEVVELADDLGYAATLWASPLDKRTHPGRLVQFYRRFGFEPTGRLVNPAGDPEMVRPARRTS